jgi:hypothetical protein
MRWSVPVTRRGVAARSLLILSAAALASATALPAAHAAAAKPAGTGFGRATQIRLPVNAGNASVGLYAVACAGNGDCAAGGAYQDKGGASEPMVVTQTRGRWARAVEVKLPANAATDPGAEVNGVACARQGSCVAVGYYQPKGDDNDQGFIVAQVRGAWKRALQAPLPANAGPRAAGLDAVTCTAAGACQAVGFYTDRADQFEAVAISEVAGRWHRGAELGLSAGVPAADLTGISCVKAGYCAAAGFYNTSGLPPFPTASVGLVESRGTWHLATKVKAPANATGESGIDGVACAPPGFCIGAGGYATSATVGAAMVATETSGRWHQATEVTARPPHATSTGLSGISCVTAKLCVGSGSYSTAHANTLALLLTWSNGKWGRAGGVSVPANALTTTPRNYLYGVGCASDGYCVAVGYYLAKGGKDDAMAVARS